MARRLDLMGPIGVAYQEARRADAQGDPARASFFLNLALSMNGDVPLSNASLTDRRNISYAFDVYSELAQHRAPEGHDLITMSDRMADEYGQAADLLYRMRQGAARRFYPPVGTTAREIIVKAHWRRGTRGVREHVRRG